jgi:hypothetical protein
MDGFWRHPALPIGAVLLVLGLGNWFASRGKLQEYERRAHAPDEIAATASLEGFKRLTARTSTSVLDRLQRRFGEYGVVDAKRDLYTVGESGGRLIAAVGLLLIGFGLLQRWRERRLARTLSRPPLAPPTAPMGA